MSFISVSSSAAPLRSLSGALADGHQSSSFTRPAVTERHANAAHRHPVCFYSVNDNVYMCTNNMIIFTNQSEELTTVRCLHVKSKPLHSRLIAIFIILIFR